MGKTRKKTYSQSRSYGYEDSEDVRHIRRKQQYERSAKSWKQLDQNLKTAKDWQSALDKLTYEE